ncbi:MAG TPA: DUF2130 domain-containing protein [Bacteroidales bacterium]|nr:DUF2130 domain-containing protein [Bacteroidales bacterium]
MEKENTISCPNCGAEINVSEILYHQVQDQLKKEFEAKIAEKEKDIQKKSAYLQSEYEKLVKDKENLQAQVDKEVKVRLGSEKSKLEETIRLEVRNETSGQIQTLQQELEQKSKQVSEFNKALAEIEKLKREKEELRDAVVLEKEKEFSEKLKDEKLKIKRQTDEEVALKIKELEKQLEDQKLLAEEMRRKADQGSMQLQGEVQELAIEEILTSLFPFDLISEVGKGVKGADVIHKVRNKLGVDCGTILYESKRTKAFSAEWVTKLKADALGTKADICIIVTETLPDGIERIGQKDGVWICSFNDFKGLVLVLRESLVKINEAYASQTNKGEKMQMLYDYLTSNEFKMQLGAIIEGFSDLQNSYIQEKRAMERIWKQREKQLEKVLLNTNHFIGSIQGIAGSSIPGLKQIGPSDNLFELEE